jgi:hemerythrin-like domain-containing protein
MNITAATRLTATSANLPPDLYGYAAMHLAMRRDATRLVRALDRVDDADAVRRWWRQFRDVIRRHHEREDDLVWPALLEVDSTFAADLEAMHAEHHSLDIAMDALDVALDALTGFGATLAKSRAAAREFVDVLVGHLEHEEAVAFHRLAQHPDTWHRVERAIERAMRPREAAFELPWLHDGLDPAYSTHLWTRIPAPVRPLVRFIWQPRYRRLVSTAQSGR